ncbi:tRNA (guanosine(46)-N7)-methyltransferase TrmB [Sulfuriferula sp.]|uniref:tRNA (guanosine(46)-N7)-methyltransferase TrmB n=1 Tax=Sulfuriferula sp. TaxID=2025307 RepID=UPI003522FCFE
MTDKPSPVGRPIRSFVLRQGRMSVAQQRAHDTLRAAYAIEYVAQPLDLAAVFGRAAPIILEIGFGMGDATAAIAAARPEHDFIGIEVHGPGVGSLLLQTEARALNNLKIIQHDAVEVLRDMIPDGSLAGVHIFFPDPWHKTRHNKRRLIKPDFVAQLARKLAPGGYLHAATDWEDYAIQILAVLSAEPALMNSADGYAPRPDYRPLTKFEQRGIRLGHGVWDIVFRKRD